MIAPLLASLLGGLAIFGPAIDLADPPAKDTAPPASVPASSSPKSSTATTPVDRHDCASCVKLFNSFNDRAKEGHEKGDIAMIFIGASSTQFWSTFGKAAWEEHFARRHAVNFGIGGDRTQHVLWRVQHGNIDGLAKPVAGSAPKVVVLMIGSNNSTGNDNTAQEIADGTAAILKELRVRLPETKVLLLATLPRDAKDASSRRKNTVANALVSKLADGKDVFYEDYSAKYVNEDGSLKTELYQKDSLHLTPAGYALLADSMEPIVKKIMGE